jgi:hypothetical protein
MAMEIDLRSLRGLAAIGRAATARSGGIAESPFAGKSVKRA